MKMVSMKMTPKKGDKDSEVMPVGGGEDKYPWGLRLNLGDEELKKLGMKELPKVGQVLTMQCQVKVVGVRASETQQGEDRNLELQVTDCGVDMGGGMDMEKKASSLYGGNKGGM